MASRAWNGSISHVIRDVTGSDDNYLLNNCGNSFDIYSKKETYRELDGMIERMEERDIYVQWYHCYIN